MARSDRGAFYESYATTHAGIGEPVAPSQVRSILRHLPGDRTLPLIDLGCGQGDLVRAMQESGYENASGIDISPEQVAIAKQRGIANVEVGDVLDVLDSSPGQFGGVTATDFFEHLTRAELLELMPRIRSALRDDGLLVGRVPNAVSPFGGNYRHGDFTHESWFTARSVRQLTAVAGFTRVQAFPSEPAAHGIISSARRIIWKGYSAFFKLGLAAETGILRGHIVTQNLIFVARP